jgi:hypothetical protein
MMKRFRIIDIMQLALIVTIIGIVAFTAKLPFSNAQVPTLPPECRVGTVANTVICTITPTPALAPTEERKYLITVTDSTGVARPENFTIRQSSIFSPVFDGKTATFTITDPDGIRSVTIAPAP